MWFIYKFIHGGGGQVLPWTPSLGQERIHKLYVEQTNKQLKHPNIWDRGRGQVLPVDTVVVCAGQAPQPLSLSSPPLPLPLFSLP